MRLSIKSGDDDDNEDERIESFVLNFFGMIVTDDDDELVDEHSLKYRIDT
jgi:hypothetical protein